MRIGLTLPTFDDDPRKALAAATKAEELGIHGVFVFDHLWPMGSPARPALSAFPMAGAIAASTGNVAVGTLVARIGLAPDAVVRDSLRGLSRIAGGRLIAGLGTGDEASRAENTHLGIPYLSAGARRESLATIAAQLTDEGIACWVGAGSPVTNAIARTTGATLNLWGVPADVVAAEVAQGTTVSWAGPLPKEPGEAVATLRAIAAAGATWAVWGWPQSIELVVDAAATAGISLGFDASEQAPPD